MDAKDILNELSEVKRREADERKVWKRCVQYVENWVDGELGQWPADVRAELGDKPTLSFNEILKFVNKASGFIRNTKIDERAFPVDDATDPLTAEIVTDLLKHVRKINDADVHYSKALREAVIIGRGFIRNEWSDARDPLGEISVTSVNPFSVYILGDGREYDLSDRRGIVEELPMRFDEVSAMFPEKEKEIEHLRDSLKETREPKEGGYDYAIEGVEDSYFDRENNRAKVLRTQYYYYKKLRFFQNEQTGEIIPVPEKAKNEEIGILRNVLEAESGASFKTITKAARKVKICYTLADITLKEEESALPGGRFDLVPFFCYTDGDRTTGIVQYLLDAQDEKNKRRSQAIHILGMIAKGSYFVDSTKLGVTVDEFQDRLGKVGQAFPTKGSPRDIAVPVMNDLSIIPALMQMDIAATAEMREISGITDASLGQVPAGVKSGRGIQELQQPYSEVTSEIYNNYLLSRRLCAEIQLGLIQRHYTAPRKIRILGDYLKGQVPLGEEDFAQQGVAKYENGYKVLTINTVGINTITTGKYDIAIEAVPGAPTMRRAKFFDMLNMKAMGAPIEWADIIDASDIKNKQEILAKIPIAMQNTMQEQAIMEQVRNATPPQMPIETDLQGNVAGAQF